MKTEPEMTNPKPKSYRIRPGSATVVDDLMQQMRVEAEKILSIDPKLGIEPVSRDLAELIATGAVKGANE